MIAYREYRRHATDWTPREDDLLLSKAGAYRLSVIARQLGRTPHACKLRLLKHGIALRTNAQCYAGMSVKDVCQALGAHKATVQSWIRIGWLKKRTGFGVNKRYISIDPDDLLRFIQERGALLRLEPDRDWAEEVAQARADLLSRLISGPELAQALCVARCTFRFLHDRHDMPAPVLRLGGSQPDYYDRAAIRAWRAAHPAYQAGSPI